MDDTTKKDIEKILDSFKTERDIAVKEHEAKKKKEELFKEKFKEKVKSVIRPEMEQFKEILISEGHKCEITEESDSSIEIYILGNQYSQSPTKIVFKFNSDKKQVEVSGTTKTRLGSEDNCYEYYGIDNITAEFVGKHFCKILKEMLD